MLVMTVLDHTVTLHRHSVEKGLSYDVQDYRTGSALGTLHHYSDTREWHWRPHLSPWRQHRSSTAYGSRREALEALLSSLTDTTHPS